MSSSTHWLSNVTGLNICHTSPSRWAIIARPAAASVLGPSLSAHRVGSLSGPEGGLWGPLSVRGGRRTAHRVSSLSGPEGGGLWGPLPVHGGPLTADSRRVCGGVSTNDAIVHAVATSNRAAGSLHSAQCTGFMMISRGMDYGKWHCTFPCAKLHWPALLSVKMVKPLTSATRAEWFSKRLAWLTPRNKPVSYYWQRAELPVGSVGSVWAL